MVALKVACQRLYQQRLSANSFASPEEAVAWMGAVQAQDYPGAKWSLGLRMRQATDDAIEKAFNEGRILRTHVMRPTWHFVTPTDIRWILELTAPRVHAANAYMGRKLELDKALLTRSADAMVRVLEGGQQRTRAELAEALAQVGIVAEGMRLGYIVHHAELERVVCSGPRRGKQFTYMLLDERAPQARTLKRDEALAELTRRYFTGHGPATVHDFVWWSGLTVADAKTGVDMVSNELAQETIDGQTLWSSVSMPSTSEPSPAAYLLSTYDEFLIGFASFDRARSGGQDVSGKLVFDSTIVIGGLIMGSWRRTFKKGNVIIELAPFGSLTAAEQEAVEAAVQRYGEFVGMPASCTNI